MEVRCIEGEDSEVIRAELQKVIDMHRQSTGLQASKDSVQSQEVSVAYVHAYVPLSSSSLDYTQAYV